MKSPLPLIVSWGFVAFVPGGTAAPPGRKVPPPVPALPAPIAPGLSPAVDFAPLRAAERALREGLPTAAVARLRPFLALPNLPPAERRTASLLLARALLETGDARGALDALGPAVGGDDAPDAALLRAGANATLGQWDLALTDYERAGDGPAARFGRAECLRALGRGPEADGLLAGLAGDETFGTAAALRRAELALVARRPGEAEALLRAAPAAVLASPAGRSLLGRAQFDAGRTAEAEETLVTLVANAPAGFTPTLLARTQLALARARAAGGRVAEAAAGLERFVDRFPRHPRLDETFVALTELRRGGDAAAGVAALERWQKDPAEPTRGGYAALTLARIRRAAGRVEAAAALVDGFSLRYPGHPWSARAGAERAALLLAAGRPAEARAVLAGAGALPGGDAADLRATLDGLEARVSLALGDFPAAAARLEALAGTPGLLSSRVENALAAAALARLRARDEAGFRAGRDALAQRFPNGGWRRSLPLEEGLLRAAARDGAGAAATLRAFLDGEPVPGPGRTAAARLALAELAYLDGDAEAARAELRFVAAAADTDPPPATPAAGDTAARADYLAILAADAPGREPGAGGRDENGVITRAKAFLARRPDSPLAPAVRLKLGEIFFRREDYPDAQTELELVPATATAPLYETARYLAGLAALGAQSPAGADRAVELFEDVARLNGPLKPAARLRQAETLRDRLGKPADAVVLYDAILAATGPAPDVETRCAALVGKAEAGLRAGKPADAGATTATAARLLAEAAAVPGAPLAWRRQALARRGAALERAGDADGAVAAYADALGVAAGGDAGPEAGGDDLTWFYRAGFSAARLLRAAGQWRQAIVVLEKLARLDGPLRAEAEGQARALRLEHFVWENDGKMTNDQ